MARRTKDLCVIIAIGIMRLVGYFMFGAFMLVMSLTIADATGFLLREFAKGVRTWELFGFIISIYVMVTVLGYLTKKIFVVKERQDATQSN